MQSVKLSIFVNQNACLTLENPVMCLFFLHNDALECLVILVKICLIFTDKEVYVTDLLREILLSPKNDNECYYVK